MLCKTKTIAMVFFAYLAVGLNQTPADAFTDSETENYARLMEFIALDDLQEPLVLFESGTEDFDDQLNRENIAYLNKNKKLLEKIKARLKGDPLRWKLAASQKRLLVVPETRPEYARLFQQYCQKAIAYVLERIQAPSPYQAIETIDGAPPMDKNTPDEGIKAYLVHNIADEYVEEYVFFNHENDTAKIKIKLQNRVYSGIIGSYTSKLVIGENSRFEFVREPYTLWQNSAKNPLNVFIAPIEETLHIVLRKATETAIKAHLARTKPQRLSEVQEVVQDWMAVEEAIVGGLIAHLMPEVFNRFVHLADHQRLSQAMAERERHAQYRYLENGIRVVTDLGLEQAMDLYKNDPNQFRDMIRDAPIAHLS